MASDLRERAPSRLLRDRLLLQAAFDGCGVPIAKARSLAGVPTGNTAATLDLLGQLLMLSGRRCLPGPARTRPRSTADEALSWPKLSANEQLKMLKALMGMLVSPPQWRKKADVESAQKPMLPFEMGPWDGDDDLPSCFGMLVILASYGFLTKEYMLAASVQRTSAEPVAIGLASLYSVAYRYIADTLPLAFRADALLAWLLDTVCDSEASLQGMATAREFHGAIVLRLRDGRWISLDPYMQNMAFLDTDTLNKIAPKLLADPAAAEVIFGQKGWSELPRLRREFQTVRGIAQLAQTNTVLHDGISLVQLAHRLAALMGEHCEFDPPTADDILRRAAAVPGVKELPDPAVARAVIGAAESGAHRLVLRERILLGAVRGWANETWRAANYTRANEPHQAMMLSKPERSLGVWAVINLRHRLRRPVLGIDLLPYSGSDVALYNAHVDHSNGQSNATERQWLAEQRERRQQTPRQLLHPLILQVIN